MTGRDTPIEAAFDGVSSIGNNTGGVAASLGGVGQAYVGKDWGSGVTKTISGLKLYGHNGEGYSGGGGISTIKYLRFLLIFTLRESLSLFRR